MENVSSHSIKLSDSSNSESNDEIIEQVNLKSETSSDERLNTFKELRKFLPSRQLDTFQTINKSKFELSQSCKTIRLPKHHNFMDLEDQVDNITKHIELQDDLMNDDPVSEQRRLEMLRDMPQCLSIKRSIKAKLIDTVNLKHKTKYLSLFKRFKYSISIFFTKRLINVRDIKFSVQLWYDAIKFIEGNFGSGVATYFKFLRWLIILNFISCILSIFFLIIPQSFLKASKDDEFHIEDVFLGNGFLESTLLYYGFYFNSTVELIPGYKYEMKSAYFLTMLCCYFLTFIFLSIKVAKSYRECYVESSGSFNNLYSSKVFCSWDCSIASSKAARLCSSSICRELKEILSEANEKEDLSFCNKLAQLLIHMNISTLVLGLIAGSGALIWVLLNLDKPEKLNSSSLFLTSLTITLIINIFPTIVSQLEKFEDYNSKRYALYITLIRLYSMTIVIIGTALVYWLFFAKSSCWQTALAEEVYRLIILDFIVSIIIRFIVESIHYHTYKTIWKKLGPPKFDIAQNTLNLIYNQILFWVAFYFTPPLAFIIVVKMVLIFYIKKLGLIKYCETPLTFWRAAQTQTLFLALTFISMTLTFTMFGYIITKVESNKCGPFRNTTYTWEAIIQEVFNIQFDSELWRIAVSLSKPGIGAAIIIAMSTIVYWLREKARASQKIVQILRKMLILQYRDKDFLLHEFSKVADENWLQRRSIFNENRMSTGSRKISTRPSLRPPVKSPHRSTSFHRLPGPSRR